jgi:hypothetical protein
MNGLIPEFSYGGKLAPMYTGFSECVNDATKNRKSVTLAGMNGQTFVRL